MQCDRQSFIHVAANSGQRGGLIPRKQRLHQPAMLIQRGLIAAIGAITLHIMRHEEVHVGVVLALKLLHLRIGDQQRMEFHVVKIPATRAGIEAIEELAATGMNAAATVSFTVPQVLAVGEAIQRGHEKARASGIEPGLGIAVLMVGRLDDYLRDVMYDTRAEASEKDIVWAGVAAIKRVYEIFNERQYDAILMPAGCRGAHHITDLAGARMIMSIAPAISEMLEGVTEFEERIDRPVEPEIIDRLMKMPEFRKAYEPDGMKPDEFITFGSCNRTLDQFVNDGWNVLKNI